MNETHGIYIYEDAESSWCGLRDVDKQLLTATGGSFLSTWYSLKSYVWGIEHKFKGQYQVMLVPSDRAGRAVAAVRALYLMSTGIKEATQASGSESAIEAIRIAERDLNFVLADAVESAVKITVEDMGEADQPAAAE